MRNMRKGAVPPKIIFLNLYYRQRERQRERERDRETERERETERD